MDLFASDVSNQSNLAIKVLIEKQKIIAKNIANSNIDGYQAERLNFDQVYRKLMDSKSSHDISSSIVRSSEKVELDKELLEMQKTVLHYKAILDLQKRNGSIMKMVIKGGI